MVPAESVPRGTSGQHKGTDPEQNRTFGNVPLALPSRWKSVYFHVCSLLLGAVIIQVGACGPVVLSLFLNTVLSVSPAWEIGGGGVL